MEFHEVLKSRHSVRDFKDVQVSDDVLTAIVRDAQHTPTWVNSQPVKVYMVTGEAAKRLRASHAERLARGEESHSEIIPLSRDKWPQENQDIMAQWSVEFKKQFQPGQVHFNKAQKELFHAPAFAFLTIPRGLSQWSIYDAGAFGNTLMLAAKNRGVDSIVAYALVTYPDEVREIADVPDEELLVVGIALGYESDDLLNTFVPSRRELSGMLSIVKD